MAGPRSTTNKTLTAEVIEENILAFNTKIQQHIDARLVHHGWSTHIVLAILRRRMVLEILLKQDVMDKSG